VPTNVIMPALGMAQETGKVVGWLKAAGEVVTKGQPLVEIETDKITVEIEAPASGTLVQVTAAAGDEVPVGQVIALILGPGELAPGQARPSAPPAPPMSSDGPAVQTQIASPVAARIAAEHQLDLGQIHSAGRRIEKADVLAFLDARSRVSPGALTPASPKARRLAAERGIDIATLDGRGPGGAVLSADVLAADDRRPTTDDRPLLDKRQETKDERQETAAHRSPILDDGQLTTDNGPLTQHLSAAWRVMAERMAQSWSSAPHFFLMREVDASRLIAWREQAQRRAQAKLTYSDLLVKLVAAALHTHPRLNAAWQAGAIVENAAINIGLAVAVEDGLLVPVIPRADVLGLGEIAARRQEIVARAQSGKLRPDDMQGGTFTISNLGMYGVDSFNAILNPPQAAILAVGRIVDRVVPVAGQPAVRPMLMLSLSCDHRVVDGARGARFLETLAELIEEPLGLIT
jgi:pyruvate dehydrogenase E2 component (dihydrolipoamide acetyltransferase)